MGNRLQPWSYAGEMPVGPRAFRPVRPPPGSPGGAVEIFDPHHYATCNGDLVLAVGVLNIVALTQPDGRRNLLMIRNSSTGVQNLFVSFGNTASVNSTVRLTPNTMILFDVAVPQDDVNIVSDAAAAQVSISYSNI